MVLGACLRTALVLLLCFAITTPALGEPPSSSVDTPSTGKAVAIVAVTGAIFALALYHIMHRHKGPSGSTGNQSAFVGCTTLSDHGLVLTDEKDGQDYVILGATTVKAGERVQVLGRKDEDDAGRLALNVIRVVQDYGPCKTPTAPTTP